MRERATTAYKIILLGALTKQMVPYDSSYFTRLPDAILGASANTKLPWPSLAQSSMPKDSIPISLAGAKLATTTTLRPSICSGS